ncbi:MAG: 1-acyl-sn-glycerol-3-phosphate acyltransferase [Chloroflexi bacterium]|nr:1-acyl-sn-glycerol-3-phosphate acyltransferase [Chloroflexota bacterium]
MTPPAVLLPSYQFSPGFFVRWLFTVLVLRRRLHAGRNALEMLAGKPRPRVEGLERLPASGPCVVVMNHYERPGLRVWWGVALATAAVWQRRGDPPMRWLMTDRFEGFRIAGLRWPDVFMAWMLGRVAWAYGHLPVPKPEGDAAPRALVLREARRALRDGGVVGVTPEAASGYGPELAVAWPGSGAAIAWLSGGKVPIVPVAFFEDDEARLVARFGEPFTLDRMRDDEGAEAVMGAVAALLPPELHGVYGSD